MSSNVFGDINAENTLEGSGMISRYARFRAGNTIFSSVGRYCSISLVFWASPRAYERLKFKAHLRFSIDEERDNVADADIAASQEAKET